MYIKPIQAKIVGTIILIAGIAMILSNINGLKMSTEKDNIKAPAEKDTPIVIDKPTLTTNIALSPASGPTKTSVTLTSDMNDTFTPTGNSVNFNGSKDTIINLNSSDGKTLTFNIPASTSSLDGVHTDKYTSFPVEPGTYSISATNSNGKQSGHADFIVTKRPPVQDSSGTTNGNSAPTTSPTPPAHIDSTENSGQNIN